MSDKITFLFVAILAGVTAGFGDVLLNHWAKFSGRMEWFVWGLLLFNASFFMFAGVLRRGFLAESLVLYIVANSLFVLVFSNFFLQESLSPYQWFWLFVALMAVIAMELT